MGRRGRTVGIGEWWGGCSLADGRQLSATCQCEAAGANIRQQSRKTGRHLLIIADGWNGWTGMTRRITSCVV